MVAIAGFTILAKLHMSSSSETYRAIRDHDKKTFILKLPAAEYPSNNDIAVLHHEYHLLKTLNISGIIRAEDLIEQLHYPILVLEDISGESLEHFPRGHALDLKNFFKLALQLTDAIGALHLKHIIHKDIKPANIIFEPNSLLVKLTDLNIASQLTEENLNYISLNKLEGTLAYMSPEQTGRMNCPLDYRTDFYSLGVTFFEILTGRLPFETNDPLELVHCHVAKVPPLITDIIPTLPHMLAEIVAKLLAKMPEERYTSAVGLKEDLKFSADAWQSYNNIPMFELARKDVHDHLNISHKLYGREQQVKQLLSAFEEVNRQGRCELFLVTGYSGIGKTAVIREIYKPIVRQKGYFISGKYDQLQRGTPYSAIIAAFKNLVKQVLAASEESLAKTRRSLLDALGNVGQVIVNLIPEVELIIGKQPPISQLNAIETQNRFNLIFQNFVQVFSSAEHPLVIFLDDLQWADNASLTFIENLYVDPNTHHLLLIGAYRDNEVQAGHSLLATLENLKRNEVTIESMVLSPLQITDIEQLLSDTFGCDKSKVQSFAVLLQEKTLGNPFFICELLKTLYQEKHVRFSYEQAEWQWDVASLKQTSMTHNVIDLLTAQIHKLPEQTQSILKLASCIGHTFSLQTLVTISEQTPLNVAQELWKAMQSRFIISLEDSHRTEMLAEADRLTLSFDQTERLYYQFSHDRIQHAVYSLVSEAIRQQTHLMIGRLLLKEFPLSEQDAELFAKVNHLNQGKMLIIDAAEKKSLAEYNSWAGKKAQSSAAYAAALTYFQHAISLSNTDIWEQNYNLAFTLYKGIVECKYLLRDFPGAENVAEILFEKAALLDKAQIYFIQIGAHTSISEHAKALSIATTALSLFDFHLPRHAGTQHVLKEIITIQLRVKRKNIPDLSNQLPIASDPTIITINQLLAAALPSAYVVNPKLYAVITCKLIHRGLSHGLTAEIPFACLAFAVILISRLNHFEEGFDFVALSKNIETKLGISAPDPRCYFLMGAVLNHWRYPLNEGINYLKKAQQVAMERGNLTYAGYSCMRLLMQYYCGERLSDLYLESEKVIAFCKRIGLTNSMHFYTIVKEVFQQFLTEFNVSDELLNRINSISQDTKTLWVFSYTLFSQLFYLKGDLAKALEMSRSARAMQDYTKGTASSSFELFFYALCLASTKNKIHLKELKKLQKQLKLWNKHCLTNYEFLYLHLSAEIAQLENKNNEAMRYFDQAIASAYKQGRIQFVAIANERAAIFYKHLNKPRYVDYYIQEAHHAYQRWGAKAKFKQIEQLYPALFTTLTNTGSSSSTLSTSTMSTTVIGAQSIDKLAILKSTLAIASEIQLDKLLRKLLQIILQDAGAERGVLLCKQGDNWVIEADGNAAKQSILLQPQLLTADYPIPITLISYVQHIMESLVIHDALHAEQTLSDPYVIKTKPKSMLALPIRYQGKLRRIFYLENNLTTGAFNKNHLQILHLIGTQAAISLENAHLYYQATHDPLTGLANRNLLYQAFTNYILSEDKNKTNKLAILFLDLDKFKTINDTLGHEVGDQVLQHVSHQLKSCLQENDLAVRLGGDEFVLMIKDVKNQNEINTLRKNLNDLLAHPANIKGYSLSICTSVGVSIYPDEGSDVDTLLRKADIALYKDKEIHHRQ